MTRRPRVRRVSKRGAQKEKTCLSFTAGKVLVTRFSAILRRQVPLGSSPFLQISTTRLLNQSVYQISSFPSKVPSFYQQLLPICLSTALWVPTSGSTLATACLPRMARLSFVCKMMARSLFTETIIASGKTPLLSVGTMLRGLLCRKTVTSACSKSILFLFFHSYHRSLLRTPHLLANTKAMCSDNGGSPIWATNTGGRGKGNVFLTVQNDGNVVLYKDEALWATATNK
jgi:hypothetical protein